MWHFRITLLYMWLDEHELWLPQNMIIFSYKIWLSLAIFMKDICWYKLSHTVRYHCDITGKWCHNTDPDVKKREYFHTHSKAGNGQDWISCSLLIKLCSMVIIFSYICNDTVEISDKYVCFSRSHDPSKSYGSRGWIQHLYNTRPRLVSFIQ